MKVNSMLCLSFTRFQADQRPTESTKKIVLRRCVCRRIFGARSFAGPFVTSSLIEDDGFVLCSFLICHCSSH